MKFVSFEGMTPKRLDAKVNEFLDSHQHCEIITMTYTASFGSTYVGIAYRETQQSRIDRS